MRLTVIERFHIWCNDENIINRFDWSLNVLEWGNPNGPNKIFKFCKFLSNKRELFYIGDTSYDPILIYDIWKNRTSSNVSNRVHNLTIRYKNNIFEYPLSGEDICNEDIDNIARCLKDIIVFDEPLPLYSINA